MGNKFIDSEATNYLQCEPFTPFYCLPKITEEIQDQTNVDSNLSPINENRVSQIRSDIHQNNFKIKKEILEEEATRKEQGGDAFLKVLKEIQFSLHLDENCESNKYDIDDYYININEPKNMRCSYYSNFINRDFKCKKNYNNLFIFDWDNTLLPTYYLAQGNFVNENELPIEDVSMFSLLEESIFKLLKKTIEKGETYIITNSDIEWVEFSIKKYFPGLVKFLKTINIISAKDEFKNIYPDNINLWKKHAFLSLKEKININLVKNIICIGDSYNELEAGKKLASKIGNCYIKTIKFKKHPEPADLIKQINLVRAKFNYIYSKQKNLSITLEENER